MDITYTAIVGADEIVIRAARRAGIDGPIGSYERPADLDEVDAILRARGFERTEAWRLTTGYAGLSLEAKLSER